MFKNTAGQLILVYAHDTAADGPKTGDAANITAYLSKDAGGAVPSDDVNPSELDATNMKGLYVFSMTQAESNANLLALSPVSATENVVLEPVAIYTVIADGGTTIITVVGGGGALPSYAKEGEQSKVVRGDVVDVPRYLTGDHTSYRLFFASKANARDSEYAISVRECENLTYDSVADETSYTIPFVAADTESIDLGIYPSEVERRDSDGISNPVTPDRFGLGVVTQIIRPA